MGLDTDGMTKFDWWSYYGIESIYKMTTSVMNATTGSVPSVTPGISKPAKPATIMALSAITVLQI
jgi:hypothetical protein